MTTNAQPARFFITYRHADAEEYAQRLYGSLALHYSDDNVFLDILSIEPGLDFTKRVDNAISECDVLLFLVGSDFLATSGSQGQGAKGRGKEALDYVHTELRAALDRGVRVVPVLVEEAGFPLEITGRRIWSACQSGMLSAFVTSIGMRMWSDFSKYLGRGRSNDSRPLI